MGTATLWGGIADDALAQAVLWMQDFAPILVVFVGVAAFGLVVYIVRRIAA